MPSESSSGLSGVSVTVTGTKDSGTQEPPWGLCSAFAKVTGSGGTVSTGCWAWALRGSAHTTPQHCWLLQVSPRYPICLPFPEGIAVVPHKASRSVSCALTCLLPCTQQLVSEKVGGAEGTKLDDDFKEMEKVGFHTGLLGPTLAGGQKSPRLAPPGHLMALTWWLSPQKVDVTSKAVAEVLVRTIEYLQPNPGKAWASSYISGKGNTMSDCSDFPEQKQHWPSHSLVASTLKDPSVQQGQVFLGSH